MEFIFKAIGTPFSYLINWFLSITNSFPLSIIYFSLFFSLFYLFVSQIQARISARSSIANKYVPIFQLKYVEDKEVFETYLTNIYKTCRVNQLSNILMTLFVAFLFMSVATIIFQPLTSVFRLDSGEIETIKDYLIKNLDLHKNASEYTILDMLFKNQDTLNNSIPEIEGLLKYNLNFFNINFYSGPTQGSFVIILPIIFLIMYVRDIIKGVRSAIKSKKKSHYIMTGIMVFFFLSLITTSFLFPVGYCLFLVMYRVIYSIGAICLKSVNKNYCKKLQEEVKPKCDELLMEADAKFTENSKKKAEDVNSVENN